MKSALPYVEMAIEAGARIASYVPSTKAEFLATPMAQDVVCMRLQEMGENLSKIRQQFPEVYEASHSENWHRLIGLRNVISHGYAELDMSVVWKIVDVHLSPLVEELAKLKASLEKRVC